MKKRNALLITIAVLATFSLAFDGWVYGEVDANLLTDLDMLPGVKTFNFADDPIRENISEADMIGPEYPIKLTKKYPDEYFGITAGQQKDPSTGEYVTGLFVSRDGGNEAKGNCGCIYRNMFKYKGLWIDVKTTYVDWQYQMKRTAFMCGGFANFKWRSIWYMEMKHEFFIAGTDTPIQVKGYLEYSDLDNSQGIMLSPGEYNDIWTNNNGTLIGYRNIQAGTDICHGLNSTTGEYTNIHQISRDMLCIQAKTNEDIPETDEEGYDRQRAATATFAYTFFGETLHTAMIDDDTLGLNVMENSSIKHIPSALPDGNGGEITKHVSDEDETDVKSNRVRSWQQWKYRIKAFLPPETEPGNMLETFKISDHIDPNLDITDIRVLEAKQDVSDKFSIISENGSVSAVLNNTTDTEVYGELYTLEITVKISKSRDEMLRHELLDENFETSVDNTAQVIYQDGKGEHAVDTNKTETIVRYEGEGNIEITKKINSKELYPEHGEAVFVFWLKGKTVSGQEREFNRAVRLNDEIGSVVFRNIPEGNYMCSEYDTYRFQPKLISDVEGGETDGYSVNFSVETNHICRATFTNVRKSWHNYSDSNLMVNRLGSGNN